MSSNYYDRTAVWLGSCRISDRDRERAMRLSSVSPFPLHVLELGAGFGGAAAAMADLGHYVTAVELSAARAAFLHRHAMRARPGGIEVIEADFNTLVLERDFDVVCYWSGFGAGSEVEHGRLLRRIDGWLKPNGQALLDVFEPCWWSAAATDVSCQAGICRRLGFDPGTRRLRVAYWPAGRDREMVVESLRCYSPCEFEELARQCSLCLLESPDLTQVARHESYLVRLRRA